MPLKTYGLTHVALAVRDPMRSAQFYSKVFGCQVVYDDDDFVQLQTPGSRDVIVLERSSRCLHRPKLASDSDPIRTPVPIESGQ